MEKIKHIVIGVLLAIVLWMGLVFLASAKANAYTAPYVTMDVDSRLGWASGTYVCKDARTCYMLVRSAEARGAHQYCNSVVMKRDGHVIWFKNYKPKTSIR